MENVEALIQRCIEDGLAIRRLHSRIEALRNSKAARTAPEDDVDLEMLEAEFERLSLIYLILQQRLQDSSPAAFARHLETIKRRIEERLREEG